MIGVYVHIPYCRTLCPYCDFVKKRAHGAVPGGFVDALCREIAAFEGPSEVVSIFFGGGTPSLIAPEDLKRIMGALGARFRLRDPEITLEANPDDITPDLVAAWRDAGINRVSIGVQSFDDRVLRYLGRRHDADAAARACETVGASFNRWNLDLIFGAPPVEAWQATLQRALALGAPHIAAYGLTYEAGTPFARRSSEAVDEEMWLRMYQEAEQALAGYDHYEISNFALPGQQSAHNLIYWHNEQYAGFGTGAYSYINGIRARNLADVDAYVQDPGSHEEVLELSGEEIRIETLIQHLRLRQGLPRARYTSRFGHDVLLDFGAVLASLEVRGLVQVENTHVAPTAQGFYLNNEIGLALVQEPVAANIA